MRRTRYKAIVDDFALRIRAGQLPPGTQLPTVRALMARERVALATALRVYQELEAIGLVVGEAGRGTFVRDSSLSRGMGLEQQPAKDCEVDLSFNYPALPGQEQSLREGLRAIAASGDLDALLHSAPQGGRLHERQTAARHLRNREIRVGAEQVLIVNGAQQGLAVSLLALLRPGDVLAVDALTYPGLKSLALVHRLDLEPLPQIDGLTDLDALEELCRRRPVRALYCMPTLHNPLGTVMPLAQRQRLAQLAREHDFWLVEDGAYAFLAEPAPPPLQTLAPERTLYISGLSKSVASGLRIGFIVAPPALIPALERAIRVSSWSTPTLTVTLGCLWIESGLVDNLEEQKRQDARQRQHLAARVLQGCDYLANPSSYFLWLKLEDGRRADSVVAALARQKVTVTSADPFATTTHTPQALRLALGSISPALLEQALHKVHSEVTR
ncbi:PLP-dependent aminotransferase family protein [Pseudomonas piscis]|uniref:aminotransferase-like domain-containing protein n=1 Tax=Pseudomonas piscis TaxID=2614538 RepID=UPI0003B3B84D|nr:PLP-dependent aminotransferase family protein [Pseudomonas piscis]ERO64916.1 GntR family transcriptional regulator [Pseudomonas piscis]ERO64940.1 GntR family transcriptional regulator [Pseudomonas piscis]